MKKVAVILSGCGYLDGSEIRESVLTLLALDTANIKYQFFALDEPLFHVINHISGKINMTERRNILQEAGRIARGEISSISQLDENEFDGLIIPGGFGVAKNLSNFAFKGAEARIHGTVASILKAFHQSKKPIGAICISPALLALTFGELNPTITLGADVNIAQEIEKTGSIHHNCQTSDCVVDKQNLFVTTPAYMNDQAHLKDIYTGITSLVNAMTALAN
ncbi:MULTISPECIES: isoprenoid biosynthesis glyoxalase ElbB [Acinetobacter]|uniref:isoprenoid biosynthesis glyoxalase ElbB n=1 Tax=Acinetobacter TaxID=469 RepID=UPI001250CA70|nr:MULTISPECIES: isoprenoid biosynthesis glyoxalase ElbB [Acinetobacter]MEB3796740.1 isoprenoid biosynthesis glyoxalase ElbB [Acinetobacter sp. IK24]MEB3815870.1 isoprenoid biosynthesis glyoxalase ElbB [Acinetobacter sp. IK22]MEB3835175.1 isoprenoid biosynthesis glyoxalase ElbB [Acinetobacter sp. IK23]MEB3838716.1 isoprenoid biosynthesis glyoxalase ElbB [Acinetobacter sp. IK25]